MIKKNATPVLLLAVLVSTGAGEFWLQPSKFVYKPGEKLMVSFKTGENFMGTPWSLKKDQIETLTLEQLSKSSIITDSVLEGTMDNLTVRLRESGTYFLTMKTKNSLNEWEGENFNAFLKDSGLDEILDKRIKTNASAPVKEYYALHTKLLLQVSDKKDDTFKKINNGPVEIVPLENPYALKIGDPIHFKILFDGKPTFGVRVKVWNRFDNRTTIQNIYTEKNGTIETRVSSPGPWMVSVVRIVPSKQSGAEWQSYRGSLVFGIEK